jgi:peptidoglycan/LPS O-acetylase OafA/YrhL
LSISEDIKSSALFLANFHFADKGSDYFQSGYSSSPILHFWSLSIEEQFYLFFPPVFLLLWIAASKIRKFVFPKATIRTRLIIILAVMSLISFMINLQLMADNPVNGYFSSLGRFWEITIGGVVFVVSDRSALIQKKKFLPVAMSFIFVSLITMLWKYDHITTAKQLAVVACVSSYFIYQESLSYLTTFLRFKILRFIGKISYSLYLWHWPIAVFVLDYSTSRFQYLAISTFLMFTLSALTWKFIERPFRELQPPKKWISK